MTTALIDIENQEKDVFNNSSNSKSNSKSPFKVLKTTDNNRIMGSEEEHLNSQESNTNAV